jgi:hypothetical protein
MNKDVAEGDNLGSICDPIEGRAIEIAELSHSLTHGHKASFDRQSKTTILLIRLKRFPCSIVQDELRCVADVFQ